MKLSPAQLRLVPLAGAGLLALGIGLGPLACEGPADGPFTGASGGVEGEAPASPGAPLRLAESPGARSAFLTERARATVVVRPNDTFGTIARRYRIPLDDLLAANPELAESPESLAIGTPLVLPLGEPPPGPSPDTDPQGG